MGGLKTIATVATVAFVTTGSSLSRANGKEQQKVDGAAFLETFDDGLDGWVKSEVEQYTGASSLFSSSSSSSSLCVFSRARREFVWRFLRLERVLNRSKSRGKDCGASCIEFRSEKKSDLDVVLSHIGPTKPPRASQKVTMDRAKSIDRRVPMTQSSNEYACPCFFLCVCAQKRVRFQSSGVFFVRGLTKSDTPFSSLCL